MGISVIGVVVASRLTGDTFAPNHESVRAFHEAVIICAGLVAVGGIAGAIGMYRGGPSARNRVRGGQLAGSPEPVVERA